MVVAGESGSFPELLFVLQQRIEDILEMTIETWLLVVDSLIVGVLLLLFIGPILDDRLKEKILKPWKGAHSSHSVCPSVRGLQVTSFGLGT